MVDNILNKRKEKKIKTNQLKSNHMLYHIICLKILTKSHIHQLFIRSIVLDSISFDWDPAENE